MKKWISVIFLAVLLVSSIRVNAEFSDVPKESSYAEALERVAALGMIGGYEDGTFNPDGKVTREQFAKAMVVAAGLEDNASTFKGASIFSDVEADRWSGGYISIAVNKGLITGMIDGKFHPEEEISFGQAVTLMVRALGYTDSDVPGLWPANYIEKARSVGLLKDVALSGDESLPRWAFAQMLDKLLGAPVKKSATAATEKTYAENAGLFTECIILGDSRTMDSLTDKQVLTDKGILYLPDDSTKLNVGYKYQFILKGDAVRKVYEKPTSNIKFSVESAVETQVKYKSEGISKTMVLPDKTTYYYKGTKQTYENIKGLLQPYTSIVLSYNGDKSGFEYGVIIDPVYSKPEIGYRYDPAQRKIGAINLVGNPTILKNTVDVSTTPQKVVLGEVIDETKIRDTNVVYQVSDIWNENRYILVIDHKIDGLITGILPNKASPATLQINSKDYTFNKRMPMEKINNTPGSFKIDDNVVALLGYDGKIVDLVSSIAGANDSYAFVLNVSTVIKTDEVNAKKTTYYAKLLLTDGSTAQYSVSPDIYPDKYKGKLVRYKKTDDQSITMEGVDYINPIEYVSQTVTKVVNVTNEDGTVTTQAVQETANVPVYKKFVVNRSEGTLNSNYAADNIKVFNFYNNNHTDDAEVKLISFSSLPDGEIPEGKVLYINTAGPFSDVSILVLEDAFNEKSKFGVVKNVASKNYSSKGVTASYGLLIGKSTYTLSGYGDLSIGSVIAVEMTGNSISASSPRDPNVVGKKIEAMDSKRIRMNGMTYRFSSDVMIYYVDIDGEVKQIAASDVDVGLYYDKVAVYLDRAGNSAGKVKAVVIQGPATSVPPAEQ